jgi:hypothetical protein
MTLAIGTALQNGTYVIDALGREDSVGPGYLATHVPSGQWVLVRVLGSRHPETIPSADRRAAFYEYLETISKLGHPLLSTRLRGFEEEGVCYQVLPLPLGLSLTEFISVQAPLSPRRSLWIIHQLADALKVLRPLGWRGVQLTPDQLWITNPNVLRFVGFNLPTSAAYENRVNDPEMVLGLTHLLYFLMTGQRAENTHAPLAVDVRHRRPGLPISLETALQRGSQSTVGTLEEWLALLPPLEALPAESNRTVLAVQQAKPPQVLGAPVIAPHSTQSTSPAVPPAKTQVALSSPVSDGRRIMPKPATWALVGTGLIAGLSGLTFGLQSRLQPSDLSGPARFNPNQSFPPLPDWRGGQQGIDWSAPASRQRFQPDYGDVPADLSPVVEPVVPPSAPAAEPLPTAVEEPELEVWEDNFDGGSEDLPMLIPEDPVFAPEPLPSNPDPTNTTGTNDGLAPTSPPPAPLLPGSSGSPEPVAPPNPAAPAPAPPPPLTSS